MVSYKQGRAQLAFLIYGYKFIAPSLFISSCLDMFLEESATSGVSPLQPGGGEGESIPQG